MAWTKEHRLTYSEKAHEIVGRMTLEEKVYLMSGRAGDVTVTNSAETSLQGPAARHYNDVPYPAGGNDRLGVMPVLFCDGPRGVVCGTGESTCFPVSMLRGATFDTRLEEEIGRAIGREIRAYGGNLFAGVCINLPYNPGWGRSQETYGEESFALGQMGSAIVRGVQAENVMSCVKHFAFNSMEISRFKVSVDCERRTEREVFLPHFRDCIDAGAAAVMSAYNLYKSIYCGHSDYLLRKVLKEEWDFDGFVMSDFVWGVRDTVEAANGGQDMEMNITEYFGERLVKAVRHGLVPEARIDESALRIVRTLLAFEDAHIASPAVDQNVIGCTAHIELALNAAREGITLLKNTGGVLPLDKTKTKKLAVFGRLADVGNIGDHGSSRVYPSAVVTPLQGIKRAVPDAEVVFYDGYDVETAKKIARETDAVVFVAGYSHDDEGEFIRDEEFGDKKGPFGGDRKDSLGLHWEDIALVKAVGPVNPCSVVVLIGGNMIMMTEWMDDVGGILMAYYPGQEGGTAIAEILFGDISPSGKLPYVLPYKETDLPQVNWDTTNQFYGYYHGYTKLDKESVKPLLPYGFGLSYTTFDVSGAFFRADGDAVIATCNVTNTGGVKGAEVLQLYVGFKNSKVDRPVKLLRGFQRIALLPGESREVTISCPIEKLKWYNPKTAAWELEHMVYELYIGTSSDERDLAQGKITL